MWPSVQCLTFCHKFSPSFTLKTKCPTIFCYPVSASVLTSYNSNSIRTFFISRETASIHFYSPFSSSIFLALSINFGTLLTYLCVHCQYLDFNLAMMLLLLLCTQETHHVNVGLCWMPCARSYLASYTWYVSLMSLRMIQSDDPSFLLTRISHLLVKRLFRFITKAVA